MQLTVVAALEGPRAILSNTTGRFFRSFADSRNILAGRRVLDDCVHITALESDLGELRRLDLHERCHTCATDPLGAEIDHRRKQDSWENDHVIPLTSSPAWDAAPLCSIPSNRISHRIKEYTQGSPCTRFGQQPEPSSSAF
eukprot:gene4613-biopygen16032